MAIRETVEIQCDRCGLHKQIQRMIIYRTTGLMASFITELETAGWEFTRDDEYKLTKTLCSFCANKAKEVME